MVVVLTHVAVSVTKIYIYICRTIKSVQFILYYIAVVCFCIKLFQFSGGNFTLAFIEYSQEQSSSL